MQTRTAAPAQMSAENDGCDEVIRKDRAASNFNHEERRAIIHFQFVFYPSNSSICSGIEQGGKVTGLAPQI